MTNESNESEISKRRSRVESAVKLLREWYEENGNGEPVYFEIVEQITGVSTRYIRAGAAEYSLEIPPIYTKYQWQSYCQVKLLWEWYNNLEEQRPLTYKDMSIILNERLKSVPCLIERFRVRGLEIPPTIYTKWGKDKQEPNIPSGAKIKPVRDYAFGLEVMDETIRPYGDNKWIGVLK